MKRSVEIQLQQWKDSANRKPLLVRGARQVGKTWSLEKFGESLFRNTIKIDFEKRPAYKRIFDGDLDARSITEQLEISAGKKIEPGKTLLFFDEIQACPRAIMSLRYFHEELPELHIVAAGSLIDFAMSEISVPVGRISYIQMHPMTFSEYLSAIGNEPAETAIAAGPRLLPKAAHVKLMEELKAYFFIGGLPACVSARASGSSLTDVFAIQDDLLASYRDDFAKYAGRSDKVCLDAVMRSTAKSAGEQITYSRLATEFSGVTNRKAFDLLCMAKVLNKIPCVSVLEIPLGAAHEGRKFKASFIDIGLMQRICAVPAGEGIMQSDLLNIYRGKLAEQFAAQELAASGRGGEVFYWARDAKGSEAEVDYLITAGGKVHPLEVKSGKGGSLRSMHNFLAAYPESGHGIVLYSGMYGERPEQRIRFIPLYFAGNLDC